MNLFTSYWRHSCMVLILVSYTLFSIFDCI